MKPAVTRFAVTMEIVLVATVLTGNAFAECNALAKIKPSALLMPQRRQSATFLTVSTSDGGAPIVGLWNVHYSSTLGAPPFQTYQQFHSDGLEIETPDSLQIGQLDQEMAALLSQHQEAVRRLAEVPGLGVDSAQQIIAEVGAAAAAFPSGKQLSSWVGACPGDEESAEVSQSHRSPKGNRHMRRILNQAANAAVKAKGTIFQIV